ncbi:MAG: NTP transferase domain-containing protein [Myxococcales bacterium]|nr:NTP transferase domain-containing protein [Myxococcales bacterium]MDH5306963.1 NTP transferase domain-containing protein [Myxococcales bacterium]
MRIAAIVTAGDRRASKAIHGESKVYLEIGSRPLVAHVVAVLQRVPEICEVWVVGDAERLEAVFARADLRAELCKPLHVVPQRRNLFENGWETYRRLLPGAGPDGRDPGPEDVDLPVLYLSADLPFATPQEISTFVRRALERRCDYALGVVDERAMAPFCVADGGPGLRVAYFNLREGRVRQSNLHLIRPGCIGNRHYIEEMYEYRHQREFGSIAGLAWRLLRDERGGLVVFYYYALMHLAGLADRAGCARLADRVRRWIPMARIERGCSALLRGRFQFVATEAGGCAADVDTEYEYEVSRLRYAEWHKAQTELAERLYGPALPAGTRAPDDAATGAET